MLAKNGNSTKPQERCGGQGTAANHCLVAVPCPSLRSCGWAKSSLTQYSNIEIPSNTFILNSHRPFICSVWRILPKDKLNKLTIKIPKEFLPSLLLKITERCRGMWSVVCSTPGLPIYLYNKHNSLHCSMVMCRVFRTQSVYRFIYGIYVYQCACSPKIKVSLRKREALYAGFLLQVVDPTFEEFFFF